MLQQRDNDNVEDNGSFLRTQKSTFTSEISLRETELKPDEKAGDIEEKSFTDRWKTNRFWLIRGTYYVLYSIWMIVMVVAGFIAWLISFLFI